MINTALIESKKILDCLIDSDEFSVDQIQSVKHFILALNVGCDCDDYNGFNCGCGHRSSLCEEALKELDKIYN